MANRWGIDLGGTKIEGVILDREQLDKPICRVRVPTEAEGGYEHVLGQLERLTAQMSLESGMPIPRQIGVGTPGAVDAELGSIKGSNTQCLNGRRMRDDLSQKLGCEIQMANDANCFALAEYHMGAARNYPTVFGVILGTGVGGGIVVNGRILNGRHGIAGEWGQMVLDPNGPVSVYGTRGTVESFVAGPSLEKYYQSQTGTHRKLRDIVAREETDPAAKATIDRLFHYLSKGLASVIDVLDPHD
jgi:predicted NBD/HSP70 family sugar kinase